MVVVKCREKLEEGDLKRIWIMGGRNVRRVYRGFLPLLKRLNSSTLRPTLSRMDLNVFLLIAFPAWRGTVVWHASASRLYTSWPVLVRRNSLKPSVLNTRITSLSVTAGKRGVMLVPPRGSRPDNPFSPTEPRRAASRRAVSDIRCGRL